MAGWLLESATSTAVVACAASSTDPTASESTVSSEVWLRVTAATAGAGAGGGGGGAVVQPESVATTEVDPSLTVALQVLDRKPEAVTLYSPLLSAVRDAVDSGDVTVTFAFARAPWPSTRRLPDVSVARCTLTAASASAGRASVTATESARSAAILRGSRLIERIIVSPFSVPRGRRTATIALTRPARQR